MVELVNVFGNPDEMCRGTDLISVEGRKTEFGGSCISDWLSVWLKCHHGLHFMDILKKLSIFKTFFLKMVIKMLAVSMSSTDPF